MALARYSLDTALLTRSPWIGGKDLDFRAKVARIPPFRPKVTKVEDLVMATMKRSYRQRIDKMDAAATKAENRVRKTAERVRRDARMVAKLKTGSLPYSPPVMSWLSRTLDRKATRITQEDVKGLMG